MNILNTLRYVQNKFITSRGAYRNAEANVIHQHERHWRNARNAVLFSKVFCSM